MAEAKKKEKWEEVLETTRANYETTVKALTKLQEETEKVITTIFKKGSDFKDDALKLVKEWVDSGNKLKDDFPKTIDDNIKKSMSLIPDMKNFDFPFKKEFEDLSVKIQENIKKAFSSFKI
jgi:polyhydroxyalkanoate synthesis regulator phasin